MSFEPFNSHAERASIFPAAIVDGLLGGQQHLLTSWQTAQQRNDFLLQADTATWWATYALQVVGCGHLMMHRFIQELSERLPECDHERFAGTHYAHTHASFEVPAAVTPNISS